MSTSEVKVKRTRLTPHKRKQALIEQSMQVFATQGIGRCGHTEIAAAAGVSVATVFNYFQSRDDLIHQVLQQVVVRFESFLLDEIDNQASVRDNVEHIADGIVRLVKEHEYWIHVWFEWSATTCEDLGPFFVRSNTVASQYLKQMFDTAMERGEISPAHQASDLVNLLYAINYMLFTQANRNLSYYELKRMRSSVFDMLCIYQQEPNASKFAQA